MLAHRAHSRTGPLACFWCFNSLPSNLLPSEFRQFAAQDCLGPHASFILTHSTSPHIASLTFVHSVPPVAPARTRPEEKKIRNVDIPYEYFLNTSYARLAVSSSIFAPDICTLQCDN
ncbi:hypothetical protein HYQ46_003877 [Verticillium longisporum]|nr:hypothetical protein HYQ46_003877 [Verticillium longisporum]